MTICNNDHIGHAHLSSLLLLNMLEYYDLDRKDDNGNEMEGKAHKGLGFVLILAMREREATPAVDKESIKMHYFTS